MTNQNARTAIRNASAPYGQAIQAAALAIYDRTAQVRGTFDGWRVAMNYIMSNDGTLGHSFGTR